MMWKVVYFSNLSSSLLSFSNLQNKYDELRRQDRSKQKDKPDKTERYISACDSVIQPVSKLVLNMHPEKVNLT